MCVHASRLLVVRDFLAPQSSCASAGRQQSSTVAVAAPRTRRPSGGRAAAVFQNEPPKPQFQAAHSSHSRPPGSSQLIAIGQRAAHSSQPPATVQLTAHSASSHGVVIVELGGADAEQHRRKDLLLVSVADSLRGLPLAANVVGREAQLVLLLGTVRLRRRVSTRPHFENSRSNSAAKMKWQSRLRTKCMRIE